MVPLVAVTVTVKPVIWGVTLFCQTCGRGKKIKMPVLDPKDWPTCETCGETSWRSADQPNDTQYPYALSHNDRKFLRALRIAQE